MRSIGRFVLLFALVVSACEKASPTAPTPTSSPTSSSVTRVMSLSGNLAFGTVETGKAAESTLTIGNSGTGTLTVTGITVPGGYTPGWASGTIAPGGSQQVTVRFAPTAAQNYDGTLVVSGDHTGGTNTAPLTGTGVVPVPALATIAGLATEQGAGVLNEATIEIRDGPDARKWTTTDSLGRFTLSGLQPGSVTVRASKSGYSDIDQQVALVAGGVVAINFSIPRITAPAPVPPAPVPPAPTPPAPTPPAPTPPPPTSSPTAYDDEILQLINDHRRSIGKPALAKNQLIWEQANIHSQNMASKKVPFGHDGFADRVATIRAALGSGGSAAENVAAGFGSAAAVVSGWLGSAGHRANIEGNATRTGVSAVKSADGVWYYTQIFY